MSVPAEENILTREHSIDESEASIGTALPSDVTTKAENMMDSILFMQENLEPSETDGLDIPNDVDIHSSDLLVQTITDDEELMYENDSYVEIGRKLVSAKNSLELIVVSQGNARKNVGWEAGNLPSDLQRINDENQASTEISKSVLLNNTNANVKANGHHVAWVDTATMDQDQPPDCPEEDNISEVVAVLERTNLTSNHSILETQAENPFVNGQNENMLGTYSSDEDLFANDKVDNSKLLSVEGISVPDPEYVSAHINPIYYSLIKRNFKKDCRSWLYKNRSSRSKVRQIAEAASSRKMNTKQ